MATSKLNLTRDQLATFLKDHEQIKQFERLFATVDAIAPDFTNEVAIAAGTAQATANDALALIEALENSLTADGAVTDAKATLALQELQALKSELQLKALEPAEQYNNAIITDYLTINEHGHGETAVGRMVWDDGEGTIDLGLKGGNVVCKIGVQEYARAYNDTLSTMTKGQVVYISGAQGNRVAVKLAKADGDANSAHTIGFVAETIAAGGEGWVQVSGPIYKVNTLGAIAGDTVYLSPTTFGAWTTTKPVAPDHLVVLGFIERVSATVGSIYIKVDNGYEIDELHNVRITSIQPDDLLQYDSGGPYWKNVAPSTVSIGTATNLAGGAAGSVPYQSGPGATTFLPIGTALQVLKVNAGATAPEWVSGAALTKVDDTNVTLTLGGTPANALLASTSLTLGWTGTLAAPRLNANVVQAVTNDTNVTGSISAQTLTLGWNGQLAVSRGGTGVATATANYVFAGPTSGGAAAPSFRALVAGDIPALSYVSSVGATAPITSTGGLTPTIGITSAALTKVDDTNVTLTLGGSPTTALLAATSLTLGWTGQLSLARGGTNANLTASAGSVAYSTATALALNTAGNSGDWLKSAGTSAPTWTAPAALTKTDDTNVTLTLGGSASTALLNAASITVGWTGTLAVSRGGTGTSTAFTAGSVVFAGASGTYSENNANLFWDNTNNRLGIGTAAPSARLNVYGTDDATSKISLYRSGANQNLVVGAQYIGTFTATSFDFYQNSTLRVRIDGSGNLLQLSTGGIGYGTGSGGAITQTTSRTTGVTLDKTNGAITLVSAAGTTAWQTFTVTNNKVAATDTIVVNQKSGTDLYMIHVTNVAAGSFKITFATTGGTTTEQPVFNFAVIKAVTA